MYRWWYLHHSSYLCLPDFDPAEWAHGFRELRPNPLHYASVMENVLAWSFSYISITSEVFTAYAAVTLLVFIKALSESDL